MAYGRQRPNFGTIMGPKISKNSGLWSFVFQKVFTGFISALLHMLIASTFRCVENMGLRGPILGPLGVPNKTKILVFGHFLTNIPLVSRQFWFTYQFQLLLEVSWISASRGPISGSFRAPRENMIQVFSHFLKYFPLVSHQSYLTCYLVICLVVS